MIGDVLAEIKQLSGQPGAQPERARQASGQTTAPSTLAERIRLDPPPQGVRRFYNTRFKMPQRVTRGD